MIIAGGWGPRLRDPDASPGLSYRERFPGVGFLSFFITITKVIRAETKCSIFNKAQNSATAQCVDLRTSSSSLSSNYLCVPMHIHAKVWPASHFCHLISLICLLNIDIRSSTDLILSFSFRCSQMHANSGRRKKKKTLAERS